MSVTKVNLRDLEDAFEEYGPLRCGLCGETDPCADWIYFLHTAVCKRCEVDVNRHELLDPRVLRAWNFTQKMLL